MKQRLLTFALAIGVVFALSAVARAETFSIEVNIEPASSADFVVWQFTDPNQFPQAPFTSRTLPINAVLTEFVDPVTGDSTGFAFLGQEFYAIDVFPTGGAGAVNVEISYSDISNPNGGTLDGLGVKAIGTVVRVTDPNGTPDVYTDDTETILDRDILYNIGQFYSAATIANGEGGRMRMYVGLTTGDPDANPPEPAAAEVFNPGDVPGDYTGNLTLSVTPQ